GGGARPWGPKGGGRAGLTGVGVRCGGFAEPDLRKAGCPEIFRDPEDLQRRFAPSLIGKRSPRAMGLLQPGGPQPGRPSARGASRMGA
ncbi:HAD family hydrolase, partial [Azospirillum brasilense]|nr:HAD family hydrolase [Azospirillum brasilense]